MVVSRLVVLFSSGGLSDVGRHAVQVALDEHPSLKSITVLTKYPETLKETNWNCGCRHDLDLSSPRLNIQPIDDWKTADLSTHLDDQTAVVSCLGHRQEFRHQYCQAHEGTQAILRAAATTPLRVVSLSSMGVEEDWPPMEFFAPGKYILGAMFLTISRRAYRDLTLMERAYKEASHSVDYLFVRPVGLGEDVVPENKWVLQSKKYSFDPPFGFNMAKMDVARYMVQEAVSPTRSRTAVVIGGTYKEGEL